MILCKLTANKESTEPAAQQVSGSSLEEKDADADCTRCTKKMRPVKPAKMATPKSKWKGSPLGGHTTLVSAEGHVTETV